MKDYNPEASFASWAIRFVASLDGIRAVLSGMSNVEQMRDNTAFMKNFEPLNDKEREAIIKAQKIYNELPEIPCTSCRYCTKGCPKNIPIPDIFSIMNKQTLTGKLEECASEYSALTSGGNGASACIKCRQCENVCPQHIKITEELEKCGSSLKAVGSC